MTSLRDLQSLPPLPYAQALRQTPRNMFSIKAWSYLCPFYQYFQKSYKFLDEEVCDLIISESHEN